MAWRIVAQPNGEFARYSGIVDDFTDYDLTYEEAVDLCIREYGMSREEAEDKVQRGVQAGRSRFDEAIRTIAEVHGEVRAAERLRAMTDSEKSEGNS